jgi:hypothetical protein
MLILLSKGALRRDAAYAGAPLAACCKALVRRSWVNPTGTCGLAAPPAGWFTDVGGLLGGSCHEP